MAPTLEDVSMLLGLPLAGNAIRPLEDPPDWQQTLAARFFNIYDGAPILASEAHGPKYDWLQHFRVSSYLAYLSKVNVSSCNISRLFTSPFVLT